MNRKKQLIQITYQRLKVRTFGLLSDLDPTHFSDLLMPCPFTGRKMFCAGPNFLSQPKNLTAFSASSKTFVPAQKIILLNANHLFSSSSSCISYSYFMTEQCIMR